MYFSTKSYLKNNHYHTAKHALSKGPHHVMGKGRNEGKKKEPEKIIRAMST